LQVGIGGSLGAGLGIQGEIGGCFCSDDLSLSGYVSGGLLACSWMGGAGANITVTNARRSAWLSGDSPFAGASYGIFSASVAKSGYKNISFGIAKYCDPTLAGAAYFGVNRTAFFASHSFVRNNNKRGESPLLKNGRGGTSRKKGKY